MNCELATTITLAQAEGRDSFLFHRAQVRLCLSVRSSWPSISAICGNEFLRLFRAQLSRASFANPFFYISFFLSFLWHIKKLQRITQINLRLSSAFFMIMYACKSRIRRVRQPRDFYCSLFRAYCLFIVFISHGMYSILISTSAICCLRNCFF